MKTHIYGSYVHWSAGCGQSTTSYDAYSRDHTIAVDGKPEIGASSDPAFRGNATRYNPEELLVASLSSCHMLWYLHLCSVQHIAVLDYSDNASGIMQENGDAGQFIEVTLRPVVSITQSTDRAKAQALHEQAHRRCFIARSVNFPVSVRPTIA
ncbi:MAG TPA: OsmC family protein [Candidatus Babeliales bacterium]|nr:OsmC family protein [Candidatus Babeliales bacterium]